MSGCFTFAIPGALDQPSGGYGYDREVLARIGDFGWQPQVLALGNGFPGADATTLADAATAFDAIEDGAIVLVDGLAFGVLDAIAARQAERLRLVALVHHPLGLESGLDPEAAARLIRSETRALACARHVIVTSPVTADTLRQDFAVPEAAITVALPGTEPGSGRHHGSDPPLLLSIGSLTYRKGHDILIEALRRIADLDWQARIAGSPDFDPDQAGQLRRQVAAAGLGERITFLGTVDDIRAEMAGADIFALASRYEGYGMAFAEALAEGLPIVACRAGAVPAVVPETAGLLVAPDDPEAFAAALRQLLADPADRRRRAEAARSAGAALPRWEATAARIAAVFDRLDQDRAPTQERNDRRRPGAGGAPAPLPIPAGIPHPNSRSGPEAGR